MRLFDVWQPIKNNLKIMQKYDIYEIMSKKSITWM